MKFSDLEKMVGARDAVDSNWLNESSAQAALLSGCTFLISVLWTEISVSKVVEIRYTQGNHNRSVRAYTKAETNTN